MKTIPSKIALRAAYAVILLLLGFAAGFPVGKSAGFVTGSEWSLVQADLLAREAGVFMPVNYQQGTFHVVVKQPRHLYRDAQERADRFEAKMLTRDAYESLGSGALMERVRPARKISLMQ